jgi:hypothetical protein
LTLVIEGINYVLSNEDWMFPAQKINFAQGGSMNLKFNMGPVGP